MILELLKDHFKLHWIFNLDKLSQVQVEKINVGHRFISINGNRSVAYIYFYGNIYFL